MSETIGRDEIYRVDSKGRVTGKFQKFVNGYCLIYPYFYPYDRHICMISIFYRTDLCHSYTINRWSGLVSIGFDMIDLYECGINDES